MIFRRRPSQTERPEFLRKFAWFPVYVEDGAIRDFGYHWLKTVKYHWIQSPYEVGYWLPVTDDYPVADDLSE